VNAARSQGPDFIIIGAQRSGTTWLHRVLEAHPSIWVPPIKELHYFDDGASKRYFLHLKRRLAMTLLWRRPLSRWDMTYFLRRRDDRWYGKLFEPGRRRGKVTGEATPAYAVLDLRGFERIKAINPLVKLIFIMRDPVERMWSATMNNALSKKDNGRLRLDLRMNSDRLRKSNYLDTIIKLDKVFTPNQIFYGFFDDIKGRPVELVTEILRFLTVEPGDVQKLLPQHAVNSAAGSKRPPPDYERTMAAAHLPWLREMCERFPGAPRLWRDRYEALLNGPAESIAEVSKPNRKRVK
jgi:hypothetical protein